MTVTLIVPTLSGFGVTEVSTGALGVDELLPPLLPDPLFDPPPEPGPVTGIVNELLQDVPGFLTQKTALAAGA